MGFGLLLAVAMLSACAASGTDGGAQDRVSEPGAAVGEGGSEQQLSEEFFAAPLGAAGQKVQSLDDAALPFVPVSLKVDERPAYFYYDGAGEALAAMAAVTSDDSVRGPYVVLQFPDDMTIDGLRHEAASAPSPGCEVTSVATDSNGIKHEFSTCTNGTEEIMALSGGQEVLVTQSDVGVGVIWTQELVARSGFEDVLSGYDMTMELLGPTITVKQALDVASAYAEQT